MPGLAVTLGADTRPFEAGMKTALNIGAQTAAQISAKWALSATGIGRSVVGLGVGLGALAAAYVVTTTAISQANAQLDRFIALGKNAESAGVGVAFLQRFSEAAEKAKLDVKEIEAALLQAGKAVRPNFEQTDPIRSRLTDLFESGYMGDRQSEGLADYRKANNNEDRIRAVVTAMQELQQAGEKLAAIDLAERLFGADVADRIRSGRLEIDAIANSLDRKRDDLITQQQVQQAQEFRERLEAAYKAIDDALQVSVALEGSGRGILNVWLAIVEVTAKAAVNANSFAEKMAAGIRAASASPMPATPPLSSGTRGEGQGSIAADLGAEAGRQARGRTLYDQPIGPERPGMTIENPPEPPRRPLDVVLNPEKYGIGVKPHGGVSPSESLDGVQTYINSLERSTAALKGEMDALGKSNAERLISINLSKAEELAKQQGITLTEEQTARIRDASRASADFREKLDDVRESQEFMRSTGGDFLKGMAADARNGVSAIDAVTNAITRLAARMQDRLLDSFADILFGKSGGNSSGIFGSLLGSTGGFNVGLNFFGAKDGHVPAFAAGVSSLGIVSGPGTGTSDSILARISTGESIINARATAAHRPLIEALNAGRLPRFATGGIVDIDAYARTDALMSLAGKPGLASRSDVLADMPTRSDGLTVNVHPPANTVPEMKKTKTTSGVTADVMIRQMMMEDFGSNGPLSQTLQDMYGLNRMTGRSR